MNEKALKLSVFRSTKSTLFKSDPDFTSHSLQKQNKNKGKCIHKIRNDMSPIINESKWNLKYYLMKG